MTAATLLALPIIGAPAARPHTARSPWRASTVSSTDTRDPEFRLKSLFLAGLDGDRAAYREFLAQLTPHLRAFLRKRLQQQPAEVEDLLQEALLAIHLHRHTFDRGQALTPWAYTITRHKLIDFTRRHARTEAQHDPLEESHELLLTVDLEADTARRDVHKLLNLLPDRHRLPLLHTRINGLSVAEAAQLTGMSEAAVKIGVHRGLKALSALMKANPTPKETR